MHTASAAIPIARAEGLYLYAADGTRYMDAISSWWVNLHGHAHPHIASAISSQAQVLDQIAFANFTHAPALELSTRLLEILPKNLSKIFYSDNGSTAVEIALKMALQYWSNRKIPRTKILSLKNGHHGETFGAMSAAGKTEFNRPFWNHLFPVESITDLSLVQLQASLERGDVACFIFEPLIQGAGGMVMYPPEKLDCLIQLCKEYEVLTIADEVMTGFGRTGTLFACDQLQHKPDFICLSKGLTGGYLSLGATVCTEDVFQAFLSDNLEQAFLHGHSYTANPLACASALASLDLLLHPNCTEQRTLIAECHRNFCSTYRHHPRVKRLTCLGTILALEYHAPTSSYFHSLRPVLSRYFLSKGIFIRPLGNVLYILPPYCIKREELHTIYQHIALTLEGDILC